MRPSLNNRLFLLFIISGFLSLLITCASGSNSRKLVIIVMDGARYTETFGAANASSHIPNLLRIAKNGVVANQTMNNGTTKTVPGHTALSTGIYENIANDGTEYPSNPSFMHFYLRKINQTEKVRIITSKDKLEVLASVKTGTYKNISSNCGINGIGTGFRDDRKTLEAILSVMKNDYPNLVFINFKEPDVAGHTGIWVDYINAIHQTDSYIGQLFDYISSNYYYKNDTDVIIVNDHGRHSDGIDDGFKGHGCNCEGCRHIMFIAYGPDFKKGFEYNAACDQTDIPVTAAYLLGVSLPASTGRILNEILVEN